VQLAASLQAVIYQQLLPMREGGRVAAFEVLLANSAVRNLVRENKASQLRNIIATGRAEGMQTLEFSLNELIAEGLVEWEDAVAVSLYPKEIRHPDAAAAYPPMPSIAGR